MAITGWHRDGLCSHHNKDHGSHHICVKNIRSSENPPRRSFCEITGQENWCDKKGDCTRDSSEQCHRDKWCVCEWAFERFVKEKGCDNFDIDTHATNRLVLDHYQKNGSNNALMCIQKKMAESTKEMKESL